MARGASIPIRSARAWTIGRQARPWTSLLKGLACTRMPMGPRDADRVEHGGYPLPVGSIIGMIGMVNEDP